MKKLIEKIHNKALLFGFDVFKLRSTLKGWSFYKRDKKEFIRQRNSNTDFQFGKAFPILNEREEESGYLNGHYFQQDFYVARQVFLHQPKKLLDIGSRLDGFVAHVACFREIEVMDIRPMTKELPNITFRQADLMLLPDDLLSSYDAISSLHVIEHFGLGRYGDPVDYYGHIKAFENITKLLKPGGRFYFSTPIGIQRVEFNAHRIFSVKYLLNILQKDYKVEKFSVINDDGEFLEGCPIDSESIERDYQFQYGCGIFELIKKDNE